MTPQSPLIRQQSGEGGAIYADAAMQGRAPKNARMTLYTTNREAELCWQLSQHANLSLSDWYRRALRTQMLNEGVDPKFLEGIIPHQEMQRRKDKAVGKTAYQDRINQHLAVQVDTPKKLDVQAVLALCQEILDWAEL